VLEPVTSPTAIAVVLLSSSISKSVLGVVKVDYHPHNMNICHLSPKRLDAWQMVVHLMIE